MISCESELTSEYPFVDEVGTARLSAWAASVCAPPWCCSPERLCGGLNGPDHFKLSAAVEMVHTATLVHDDVLDEAAIRRHLDTVNARWDNEASILLGDYLFARSLCLAASCG